MRCPVVQKKFSRLVERQVHVVFFLRKGCARMEKEPRSEREPAFDPMLQLTMRAMVWNTALCTLHTYVYTC